MVCVFCLLPLFLIPVVNALPILFYFIMAKVYGLLGWEYRQPERVPPACPFKPAANKNSAVPEHGHGPHGAKEKNLTSTGVDAGKND